MSKIAENIDFILRRTTLISKNNTTVVAVTKNFDQKTVIEAIKSGILNFGENRVQECEPKFSKILQEYPEIVLHMIGPLQTNKVGLALKLFDVIHSLDREKLALEIVKKHSSEMRAKDFFIQVNIGLEEQKSGVAPGKLNDFVRWCLDDLKLNVVGLMCIPPINQDSKKFFLQMQVLAKQNNLHKLSMGMSSDFEDAIQCGSTHVRIGTAIFGER